MKTITLNNSEYIVNDNEAEIIPHEKYNNLILRREIAELERHIGLICDLAQDIQLSSLLIIGWSHGGFLANEILQRNILKKIYIEGCPNLPSGCNQASDLYNEPDIIYIVNGTTLPAIFPNNKIILSTINMKTSHNRYFLQNSDLIVYIPEELNDIFMKYFKYYFDEENNFKYDNLIHLCIMVKNAGYLFEQVLKENLQIIDRWTILDTGSTDETVSIIKKVLIGKKGELYEEPFINFRDSRNRCLDLAGKKCKYTLMLDDTYTIRGDLRSFLNEIRSDQFANSYSLLIKSNDTEYYSNRVIKTAHNLRYIYKIHEVITNKNNITVVIPKDRVYIFDYRADYMEKRTMDRKKYDLELLFEELKEDPTTARHLYYIAQTYNLMEDFENAAKYFELRAISTLEGHIQEAVDSYFELARLYNYKLNKPWEMSFNAYMKSYELDPTRPDPLYFIGIHYYMEGDRKTAYEYFKKAFKLGYPIHAQFSLKPTLSYHFLPKLLTYICYEMNDWELGYNASSLYLENNKKDDDGFQLVNDWHKIFRELIKMPQILVKPNIPIKPYFVFVVDGNWNKWTGRDILSKGLGGSETYIVELARHIQADGIFDVIVFCRCSKIEYFEDVQYRDIDDYPTFVATNAVHTCIISRYTEHLPVALNGNTENCYLVLHDLSPSGCIIPMPSKLKKIFCLTEWHCRYFIEQFPHCKNITEPFYYGIDNIKFTQGNKIPNSFIYSSYPNRGLLQLLRMWPSIKMTIPDATLNIYSDINGKWVNEVESGEMEAIKILIERAYTGITVHGWVSKNELAEAWSKADIWFYPCTFKETFCLTALEAAASGTLAITSDLAALAETVCDRGILIPGDARQTAWHELALAELFKILANPTRKSELIQSNLIWAQKNSWYSRATLLLNKYIYPTISPMPIKIRNLYYQPIREILDKLEEICKNMSKVLEVGPGIRPFLPATYSVDNNSLVNICNVDNPVATIYMDINKDKFKYEDKYFEFGYCRHVLEDIYNPEFAFLELTRVAEQGYIETPSPMIEILRGIMSSQYRGYDHHRYFIWTDKDGVLNFLPKFPIIEYLTLDKEYENKLIEIANNYPIYWNNYYIWNKNTNPKCKMLVHAVDFRTLVDYPNLILKAISDSIENTNRFMKQLNINTQLIHL